MDLLVPWRFFLPWEAHRDLSTSGSNGNSVQDIAKRTGARIDENAAGVVATSLGGAVLTLYGTMWQKRTAARHIVDRLFEAQGCDPARWANFTGKLSIVLPASTYSAVASARTREDVELIHAQISVREVVADIAKYLVDLQGNAQQVISGVTRVNTVLQDLADHGQLRHADFTEEAGQAPPSIQDLVGAARQAPAAGLATQAPHSHPAFAPSARQPQHDVHEPKPQIAPTPSSGADAHRSDIVLQQNDHLGCQPKLWKQGDWAINTALWPSPSAKLPVLLPVVALADVFLPRGHFAEIAQRCGVQIDIGDVVSGGMQVVMLTGPLAANALATMHLQWRLAQWHCGRR